MGQVVVGIDVREPVEPVLDVVVPWARALGHGIVLVYVGEPEPPTFPRASDLEGVDDGRATASAAHRRQVEALAERLLADGIEARAQPMRGATVEALVAVAEAASADLLAVGAHQRGWLARAFLGSVSHGLLRHAPCPVLVVPLGEGGP